MRKIAEELGKELSFHTLEEKSVEWIVINAAVIRFYCKTMFLWSFGKRKEI